MREIGEAEIFDYIYLKVPELSKGCYYQPLVFRFLIVLVSDVRELCDALWTFLNPCNFSLGLSCLALTLALFVPGMHADMGTLFEGLKIQEPENWKCFGKKVLGSILKLKKDFCSHRSYDPKEIFCLPNTHRFFQKKLIWIFYLAFHSLAPPPPCGPMSECQWVSLQQFL